MPLLFLLDEDTRDNSLVNAIEQHNVDQPSEPLDVLRVGDDGAPPTGTQDPDLIEWAVLANRLIISQDRNTLIDEHDRYVAAGHQTPGVLMVLPRTTIAELVKSLALIAHYSEPEEWQNLVRFIPL